MEKQLTVMTTLEKINSFELSKQIEQRFVVAIKKYSDWAESLYENGSVKGAIECHQHIDNYLQPIVDAARLNMISLSH